MIQEKPTHVNTAHVFISETVDMKVSKWQKEGAVNSWQKIGISLLEAAPHEKRRAGVSNPNGSYWKSLLDGFGFSGFLIDPARRNEILYDTTISLFEKVAMLYDLKFQVASSVGQEKVNNLLLGS